MAARKVVGLNIEPSKKMVSLSLLAKNSKKRVDKKSGRKRPRKNDYDYDVIAAPDSKEALQTGDLHKRARLDTPDDGPTTTASTIFITDLDQCDIDELSTNAWLSDKHINAAHYLLKSIDSTIGGFQDTVKEESWKPVTGKYVQIFHVNDNHWITVSTIQAKPGTVHIYDSAIQNPTLSILNMISRYHRYEGSFLNFEVLNVQQQPNSYDCGPYAVAFATSLVSGLDPTQLTFNKPREHLLECFKSGKLTQFPSSKSRRKKHPIYKITKRIFCTCRGLEIPEMGDMIQCDICDNWSHINCVLGNLAVPSGPWFCSECDSM